MKRKFYPFLLLAAMSLATIFTSCSKSSGGSDGDPEPGVELDGSKFIDKTFSGLKGVVWVTALQSDGKILVAGSLGKAGEANMRVYRLTKDGQIDPSFDMNNDKNWTIEFLTCISPLAGGKVLMGGTFKVSGVNRYLIRLNADGSVDRTFAAPADLTKINSATTMPNGRIVITGTEVYPNNYEAQRVRLLNDDGTVNNGLHLYFEDRMSSFNGVLRLSDGKLMVYGQFALRIDQEKNIVTRNLIRLNADGTIDKTFAFKYAVYAPQPFSGITGFTGLDVQGDGKFVAIGGFISYDIPGERESSRSAGGVLRINAAGTIDESFKTTEDYRGQPSGVKVFADGKVLVTRRESIYTYNQHAIMYTNTGATDKNFVISPRNDESHSAYGILKQADNQYLIWGSLGFEKEGIVRIKF